MNHTPEYDWQGIALARSINWKAVSLITMLFVLIALYKAFGQCGNDRADVKHCTDGISLFKAAPGSVAAISRLKRVTVGHNTPRALNERQPFTVKATLVGWKTESDLDWHLVIEDSGKTMIIESVNPECANGSPYQKQMQQVRESLVKIVGSSPSAKYKKLNIPIIVTGVLFEDFGHGQTGHAENFYELHPVISIERQ